MIFSVIWNFMSLWYFITRHFLLISEQIGSWMMDEFIHWPKPDLLLSATCDEILSWMIEIWMKMQFVSDINCKSISPQINYK